MLVLLLHRFWSLKEVLGNVSPVLICSGKSVYKVLLLRPSSGLKKEFFIWLVRELLLHLRRGSEGLSEGDVCSLNSCDVRSLQTSWGHGHIVVPAGSIADILERRSRLESNRGCSAHWISLEHCAPRSIADLLMTHTTVILDDVVVSSWAISSIGCVLRIKGSIKRK